MHLKRDLGHVHTHEAAIVTVYIGYLFARHNRWQGRQIEGLPDVFEKVALVLILCQQFRGLLGVDILQEFRVIALKQTMRPRIRYV